MVTGRRPLVSLGLAVLVKADFFEILGSLHAPWDTLGWIRLSGSQTTISPALDSIPRFLYAVGGSAVTGLSLGFGSKFWHDLLDVVYGVRRRIKQVPDT